MCRKDERILTLAETVNMQQTEYDSVLEKLKTLHQEELESAREIAKKIKEFK